MWGVGCLPFLVMGYANAVWVVVVAGVRAGRDLLGADGDLGDAAPAPGAAAPARPGRLARLLRVDQPDAGLDGAGRSGGRRDRPAHDVPRSPRSCPASPRWSRSSGQAAGRRARPPAPGRGAGATSSSTCLVVAVPDGLVADHGHPRREREHQQAPGQVDAGRGHARTGHDQHDGGADDQQQVERVERAGELGVEHVEPDQVDAERDRDGEHGRRPAERRCWSSRWYAATCSPAPTATTPPNSGMWP